MELGLRGRAALTPLVASILVSALGCARLKAPSLPPDLEERTITALVIVHRGLVDRLKPKAWQTQALERVASASRLFEEQFRLRFVVGAFQIWDREVSLGERPHDLLDQLRGKISAGANEIVIAFVPWPRLPPERIAGPGAANFEKGYVLARADFGSASSESETITLVHELGHLFGAKHVYRIESVMGGDPRETARFDRFNEKIVMAHRLRDFQAPEGGEDGIDRCLAIEAYRELLEGEGENDDTFLVHRRLGELLLVEGDLDGAARHLAQLSGVNRRPWRIGSPSCCASGGSTHTMVPSTRSGS